MRTRIGFSVCGSESNFYQSYGIGNYAFLGKSSLVFSNIEKHNVDEILIISPRSNPISPASNFLPYDYKELEKNYIGLPVIMSGSLRYQETFEYHSKTGVSERFMFSTEIVEMNTKWIDIYANNFGRQSIIGCLPLIINNNNIAYLYDDHKKSHTSLTSSIIDFAYDVCDEVVFQDLSNYGDSGAFAYEVIMPLIKDNKRTIFNGGCNNHTLKLAKNNEIAAVYFDNLTMHNAKLI